VRFCATQSFQSLSLIFLQLEAIEASKLNHI
jgi:hypothetical protein